MVSLMAQDLQQESVLDLYLMVVFDSGPYYGVGVAIVVGAALQDSKSAIAYCSRW